jgi:hypothetical protein
MEHAISQKGLDWDAPEVKHLDHAFSDLDPDAGLYWQYERAGLVERFVADSEIERAMSSPPNDTRAWLRGTILSHTESDKISDIDWDKIRWKTNRRSGFFGLPVYRSLSMPDPLSHTKEECLPLVGGSTSMDELLGVLDAEDTDGSGYPYRSRQEDPAGSNSSSPHRSHNTREIPKSHSVVRYEETQSETICVSSTTSSPREEEDDATTPEAP